MVSIVFPNPPLSLPSVINLLPSPKLFPPLFLFSHLPNPSLYNDEELFRSCYHLFEVAALQFNVQNMYTGKVSNFFFFTCQLNMIQAFGISIGLILIQGSFGSYKYYSVSSISILLFKGLPLIGFLIFQFKNTLTPLCLSRDKTKGHSGKNVTLTPTKTLPKKQDYSPVIFQIALSTYKLDLFFKKKKKLINQILKIKKLFFLLKKKATPHTRSACDEASIYKRRDLI